jgi:hypothetical protein
MPARRPVLVIREKSDVFVDAGRRGAEKRWSDPASRRVARLDALTPPQRAVVLALIDAARAGKVGDDAT